MRRLVLVFAIAGIICAGPALAYDSPPNGATTPDWWTDHGDMTITGCWDLTWDANGDWSSADLVSAYHWDDPPVWWSVGWDSTARELSFWIDNEFDSELWKEVYVWWQSEGPVDEPPICEATVKVGDVVVEEVPGGIDSDTGYWGWYIYPQPGEETITWTLPEGTTLSGEGPDVCIGTNCTPEPCSALLLAFAAPVAVLARRRRK